MAVEVVQRQESLPARISNFYQEVVAEMRKVTWPDREQLKDTTIKIIIYGDVLAQPAQWHPHFACPCVRRGCKGVVPLAILIGPFPGARG